MTASSMPTPSSAAATSDASFPPVPVKESKNSLISCANAVPSAKRMNLIMWSNDFAACDSFHSQSDSAHSCPCNDFFNRYILFQRHVFGRDDKRVCRVIFTATEEAVKEISIKIVAVGLILKLELTHRDGRNCAIEVEPRFTDQLCFSCPSSISIDLTQFTRTHKFVKASERHFMIFLEDVKEH
ncbi:hypothetical protein PRIPAC_83423 [Pristionchus pacificus]|uniref:Uncharacterized protein n=1 Tax=Pristionchus pacificus TaxID=54126 RepID=A0A2A6BND8_PRIPA|nr:hypothetical protein PRIPAC_83423 [Pristionchus pacificus]|eukprot:PDM67430.1 hypothetical protein PRIPAC_48847 [Pristionchus pacificus]